MYHDYVKSSNGIILAWKNLKLATLPMEAGAVDNVLDSHSPRNIQKLKVPSGRKFSTGLGWWDPTSKKLMVAHEEAAAKRCKKSPTVSRVTKEKDKTTANKLFARKKSSSVSREAKEKDLTTAKKASAGQNSTVTRRAKFETQKKYAVTKPAKTQSKVAKKLDKTTAKVLPKGE